MLHLTLCLNTINQALLNSLVYLDIEHENDSQVVSDKKSDKRFCL